MKRPLPGQLIQFLFRLSKNVLVGYAPDFINMHWIFNVVQSDKSIHALGTEKTFLVVPAEIPIVDIHIVVDPVLQKCGQPAKLLLSLRLLHEVFVTGEVGETGTGGKHALMGVGAIGKKAGEQHTLLSKAVK